MTIHGVLWLTILGAAQGFQTSQTNTIDAAGDAARGQSSLITTTMDRKYEADHRAAIAKGFKPHADTKLHANEDPLVFSHQFQHYDPEDPAKLVYYQYKAKRHANVTVLSAEHVAKCTMLTNATNNHTTVRLALPSTLAIDKVLVLAAGCEDADGTTKPFQGVVLAQSATSSVKAMSIDGVETSVQERTLSTAPAATTDVFKWSTLEYYRGKPGNLQASRQARFQSLTEGGGVAALNVDDFGFASADEILEKAGASVKAVEALARDKEEAARKERARAEHEAARKERAKREARVRAARTNHSVSTTDYCYPDGYELEFGFQPYEIKTQAWRDKASPACDTLKDEDVKASKCCYDCYQRYDKNDPESKCIKWTLYAGCEYAFRYKAPKHVDGCEGYNPDYWDYDMYLGLYEVDNGYDDPCFHPGDDGKQTDDAGSIKLPANLQENAANLDLQKSDPAYGKVEFIYKVPTAEWLADSSDCTKGDGSFPEYQLQGYKDGWGGTMAMSFPNPDRHADPGSGYYFRIGTHQDVKGKKTLLGASFNKSVELASGVKLKAVSKSGVDVETDVHMMVRSSQFNPYAEAYIVGDISVIAKVDLLVGLYAKGKGTRQISPPLFDDVCALPFCVKASLAGYGIDLGVKVGISVDLEVDFDAHVELTYIRTITTTGTLNVHWTDQGAGASSYQILKGDFSKLKTTTTGKDDHGPELEVSAKAVAGLKLNPKIAVGLWANTGNVELKAFAEVDMVLTPTATATFKWSSREKKEKGTDFLPMLPEKESCEATEFKFDSTKAAEPSADCCNGAFPYCNDVCQKDHHFQMDINLPATVWIKLHAEAGAGVAPWNLALQWIRWVQVGGLFEKKVPILTMAMHLASICYGEKA